MEENMRVIHRPHLSPVLLASSSSSQHRPFEAPSSLLRNHSSAASVTTLLSSSYCSCRASGLALPLSQRHPFLFRYLVPVMPLLCSLLVHDISQALNFSVVMAYHSSSKSVYTVSEVLLLMAPVKGSGSIRINSHITLSNDLTSGMLIGNARRRGGLYILDAPPYTLVPNHSPAPFISSFVSVSPTDVATDIVLLHFSAEKLCFYSNSPSELMMRKKRVPVLPLQRPDEMHSNQLWLQSTIGYEDIIGCSVYQYWFIVDGQWRYAPDLPWVQDAVCSANNLLDLQDYVPEDIESTSSFEPPQSPESSYSSLPLGAEDFAKELPLVPPHLQLSLLNLPTYHMEIPPPLSRPKHVILNHLYIQKGKNGHPMVALGSTHRFRSKYATVLL
ncbi:SNF1-related protein kinase regulatory subunit beta-2 [Hibiscus syriacus]|uniref:SNF1-related protein kinase regulatory subunit beta-2 n=1 Tax=Hibiscus syriacus TaxID=106335 RepID=A0A6A3C676_HIBSY|nr:SNF1-related protein kinase regulatory subunit beta-2 [Hibiscus syriacus]